MVLVVSTGLRSGLRNSHPGSRQASAVTDQPVLLWAERAVPPRDTRGHRTAPPRQRPGELHRGAVAQLANAFEWSPQPWPQEVSIRDHRTRFEAEPERGLHSPPAIGLHGRSADFTAGRRCGRGHWLPGASMPALQPLAYILCCDWSKVIGMRRRQVVVIATSVGIFAAVVGWLVTLPAARRCCSCRSRWSSSRWCSVGAVMGGDRRRAG